ncbi:MAG: VCBS domain-containing protein [Bacteriovoracaceae bacterium]|nr:VCBS domain-containing protein [Bacteriovoracaceae bacterium]
MKKIFSLLILSLVVACLPKEQDNVSCPDGQVFDTAFRKCVVDSLASNNPPIVFGNQTFNAFVEAAANQSDTFAFTIGAATDDDGDSLQYIVVVPPTYGTLDSCMDQNPTTTPDLTCNYIGNANFAGTDTFTYKVNDGKANSPTNATVTITVTGSNDAPTYSYVSSSGVTSVTGLGTVGTPYNIDVIEGNTMALSIAVDEGGFSDENIQSTSITSNITTAGTYGLVGANIGYTWGVSTGTAAAQFNFSDGTTSGNANNLVISIPFDKRLTAGETLAFNIVISDGLTTSTMYFTIDVSAVDDPIVLAADTAGTTPEDTAAAPVLSITAASDPDSAASVIYCIDSTVPGAAGTLASCADADVPGTGTAGLDCDFTPAADFCGIETFTVYACDIADVACPGPGVGTCTSATSTHTVTVTCNNTDAPVITATNINVDTTTENVAKSITISKIEDATATTENIEVSDVDIIGATQSYKYRVNSASFSDGGTLTNCDILDAWGTDLACTYTPATNFAGTETFEIDVQDVTGLSSAGGPVTLNMVVIPFNDDPTIDAQPNVSVNEGVVDYKITLEIDEGGGVPEDCQELRVAVDVTSSTNAALLPEGNISIYDYSGAIGDTADNTVKPGTLMAFGDTTNSGDAAVKDLLLEITPVAGETGTATIRVYLEDSDGTCGLGYTAKTAERTFTFTVNPVSALHGGWENLKAIGPLVNKSNTQINFGDGYIQLNWSAFSTSGASVSGWYIYRDIEPDGDGLDINADPINLGSPVATGTRSYTDTDDNATNDLVEGQVYYYKVRPLMSNGLVAETSESYSTVRMMYPPANWVFVHRWAVNKRMCQMMGKTPLPLKDFGCRYNGPGAYDEGADVDTTDTYYRLRKDMLVMAFEAGCNYSPSPTCTASGCIGTSTPGATIGADVVYYNRDDTTCYYDDPGFTSVESVENGGSNNFSAAIASGLLDPARIYLPPIVNLSKDSANTICNSVQFFDGTGTAMTLQPGGTFTDDGASKGTSVARLPYKYEQSAYSLWYENDHTDTQINTREAGQNLDTGSSGYCNTDDANGMIFVDSEVPTSAFADTLPATASNSALSSALRTGSDITALCASRFGVQDHVGNVSEFIQEELTCTTDTGCTMVTNFNQNHLYDDTTPALTVNASFNYSYDGVTGPFSDASPVDDVADGLLAYWAYSAKENDATRFSLPLGLVFDNEVNVATFIESLIIGTGGGQTSPTVLHSDSLIINADFINAGASNTGQILTGGDYTSGGAAAGVYHFEAVSEDNAQIGPEKGFRCVVPVEP